MEFSGWSPPNAVMSVPVMAWDVRLEHAKSHGEWMGLRDILITTIIIMIPYRQVSLLSFMFYLILFFYYLYVHSYPHLYLSFLFLISFP
jgi:hypothetical protein